MKNITILRRDYLKRSDKGGWYSNVTDYIILTNMTDNKLDEEIHEINNNYRTNLYRIDKRYIFSKKKDVISFITYYVNNKNTIKELKNYESLVIELIKKL